VTYPDWREPVRRLHAVAGPATDELLRVADALGCHHDREPHGVLSAIVMDWLHPVIHGEHSLLATEKQLAYLELLGHLHPETDMRRSVASAWIDHHLSIRTAQALERLQLASGDRVYVRHDYVSLRTGELTDQGATATVSSIGANGLVYFKGGNGRCAWPTRLLPIPGP